MNDSSDCFGVGLVVLFGTCLADTEFGGAGGDGFVIGKVDVVADGGVPSEVDVVLEAVGGEVLGLSRGILWIG